MFKNLKNKGFKLGLSRFWLEIKKRKFIFLAIISGIVIMQFAYASIKYFLGKLLIP